MLGTDLKTSHKELYGPASQSPARVEVPDMGFLMLDGTGSPEEPAYQDAVATLFKVAYALKFQLKKEGIESKVLPLEGLWSMVDGTDFDLQARNRWQWTMMIGQPKEVTSGLVAQTLEKLKAKQALSALERMRFERFHEGLAAQILHVGSYATEGPTIAKLHEFIAEQGYQAKGRHHEIYLGDPRKTAPEKLKTIIRQPMG